MSVLVRALVVVLFVRVLFDYRVPAVFGFIVEEVGVPEGTRPVAGNVDATLESAIMADRTCMYSLLLRACSNVCCSLDSKCRMTVLKRSNVMCDGLSAATVVALPPMSSFVIFSRVSTKNPRLPMASSAKTYANHERMRRQGRSYDMMSIE